MLRKNYARKKTPYYPIFAKEKLRQKKLQNQELEFADGFRRIKNSVLYLNKIFSAVPGYVIHDMAFWIYFLKLHSKNSKTIQGS